MTDQTAELLKAREIHEHQAVESGRSREHAEQHARARTLERSRSLQLRASWACKLMADIQEHPAVDAEAKQHGCRSRGGGRQLDARESEAAQYDHQRQRRRECSHRDEPETPEDDEQKRENERERPDRI